MPIGQGDIGTISLSPFEDGHYSDRYILPCDARPPWELRSAALGPAPLGREVDTSSMMNDAKLDVYREY